MSDKTCKGNENIKFMFSNFFFPENRTVYVIMWKNMVQPTGHRCQYNTAHALCVLYN